MATQLDMAEQQLFGWQAAKQGETLLDLVDAMGLTLDEFDKLVEGGMITYLGDGQRNEIINHLRCKTA